MAVFVMAFGAGGCKKDGAVYHAGVCVQTEPYSPESAETDLSAAAGGQADIQEASAGYVHVCGAVNAPGVYPFREGMRLFEAVELAGGFSPDADEVWLNQAQILQDGQRLYIYTHEETKELQNAQEQPTGEPSAEEKVNINTADKAELMTLSGIGEARAEAIIQYRSQHGGFSAVEEIQEISGIKNAVYSKIKDRITV